jgi:molybdopterin-binding protein
MAIYRGKVVAFSAGSWTATIRLDGSAAEVLTSVPTARNIASAEMTAGRRVLVDTGDHNDPADLVVFAVWT